MACTKSFEGRAPRTEFRLTAAGPPGARALSDHMEALIRATRDTLGADAGHFFCEETLSCKALPSSIHVAIIMDGNGRWAPGRGLPRSAGHRAGAERCAAWSRPRPASASAP